MPTTHTLALLFLFVLPYRKCHSTSLASLQPHTVFTILQTNLRLVDIIYVAYNSPLKIWVLSGMSVMLRGTLIQGKGCHFACSRNVASCWIERWQLGKGEGDSAEFYMEKVAQRPEKNWKAENLLECINQCELSKTDSCQTKVKEQGWNKGRNSFIYTSLFHTFNNVSLEKSLLP